MLKHLLVPLDGSPLAEAVLPAAAFVARKTGAQVTLLHVLEAYAPATVHGQRHLRAADESQRYLQEVAERMLAGVRVQWHVHDQEVRDVAASVHQHAGEYEGDLILMSDHGRSRFRDHFFGNLAQQIVQRHSAAVLLLRGGADGTIRFPFRQILVPLRQGHERGLPYAEEFARICEASVELLMVVATRTISGPSAVTGELLPGTTRELLDMEQQEAARQLEGVMHDLGSRQITAFGRVATGRLDDAIEQAAQDVDADMVVLATHGQAGTKAFWQGSLTSKLVAKLGSSVLLVQAEEKEP